MFHDRVLADPFAEDVTDLVVLIAGGDPREVPRSRWSRLFGSPRTVGVHLEDGLAAAPQC